VDREIVATREEAEAQTLAPLIVREPLEAYLDGQGLGRGPLRLRRIGDGHSNITYSLVRGDERLILRRGPRPPIPRSTHDMLREARTQMALRAHGIPVPEIVAVCDDESVLGVPFYLMRELDGVILGAQVPAELSGREAREQTGFAVAELLAQLHSVPVEAEDIAPLGRPAGYLDRQLAVFAKLWHAGAVRDIPVFDEVSDALVAAKPDTSRSSVVHGDFRLGNIMMTLTPSPRVSGLLDWEMSTLGDPLADVGYFLATYTEPGGEPSVMELSRLTGLPGFPSRAQLVDRYAEHTGHDVAHLDWYQALALWKSAVFCEEIHQRWKRGEGGEGAEFARALEQGVPDLLHRARALLG